MACRLEVASPTDESTAMDASGHAAALAKVLDGLAQSSIQDVDASDAGGEQLSLFLPLLRDPQNLSPTPWFMCIIISMQVVI